MTPSTDLTAQTNLSFVSIDLASVPAQDKRLTWIDDIDLVRVVSFDRFCPLLTTFSVVQSSYPMDGDLHWGDMAVFMCGDASAVNFAKRLSENLRPYEPAPELAA